MKRVYVGGIVRKALGVHRHTLQGKRKRSQLCPILSFRVGRTIVYGYTAQAIAVAFIIPIEKVEQRLEETLCNIATLNGRVKHEQLQADKYMEEIHGNN